MSNCPGTILLDYTSYSESILDEIDSESVVNIYIFNSEDICADILSYTYAELEKCDFEFEVPITYRNCNALVWHGGGSSEYDDSSMAVGTSLDDFYLKLNHDGERYSKVTENLWAAPLEAIDFCASKTRHRIYVTRLHTLFNVSLSQRNSLDSSTSALDMSNYLVEVSSKGDVYHRDYTISTLSSDIIYDNDRDITDGENQVAQVGILRVDPSSTTTMTITDKTTAQKVTFGGGSELDLVKYMLATQDAFDSASEQEFLDLNKVWDISLTVDDSYGYAAITLTINGWTTWFDTADLN